MLLHIYQEVEGCDAPSLTENQLNRRGLDVKLAKLIVQAAKGQLRWSEIFIVTPISAHQRV
jgi:hypothetical protein